MFPLQFGKKKVKNLHPGCRHAYVGGGPKTPSKCVRNGNKLNKFRGDILLSVNSVSFLSKSFEETIKILADEINPFQTISIKFMTKMLSKTINQNFCQLDALKLEEISGDINQEIHSTDEAQIQSFDQRDILISNLTMDGINEINDEINDEITDEINDEIKDEICEQVHFKSIRELKENDVFEQEIITPRTVENLYNVPQMRSTRSGLFSKLI